MVPLPWIFVHLCRTLSLPLLSGLYDTQGDPGGLDLKIPTKGFFWTYENRLIRAHTHLCPIFRQFFGWFVASRQQTFFPKILSLTVYIVIYIHFKHLFSYCHVVINIFCIYCHPDNSKFSTWHYLHVCIKKSTKTLYCFNAKRWNRK